LLRLLVSKRKPIGFELSQAGRGRLMALTFGIFSNFVLFSRIEDPERGGTTWVG